MASPRSSSPSRDYRSPDGSLLESPEPPQSELDALRSLVRGQGDHPGLVDVLPRLQRSHKKELRRARAVD
ncbi:MAG TPA: hypothetical protein VF902_08595, partial [Coriobacteriia bacterium]